MVRNEARKVLVISPAEFDQLSWCGPWEEVVLFNPHETDIDQGIEPDERDDLASCWTQMASFFTLIGHKSMGVNSNYVRFELNCMYLTCSSPM